MCNENDRELIRIDFQLMDLRKEQEKCDVYSEEYQGLQVKIDELQARKEIVKTQQLKAGK